MFKKILFVLLLVMSLSNANNNEQEYSIYFLGIVKHFYPVQQTNEGNVEYISVSKTTKYKDVIFENGIGSYTDSYNIHSFNIYTNISKEGWQISSIKPMVGLAVHSKGVEYNSNKRKIFLLPSVKFRIGKDQGFFINIMPIPKVLPYTNGFVATEIGYAF